MIALHTYIISLYAFIVNNEFDSSHGSKMYFY